MGSAHIGVIGLAVMGRNLVLNLADHGFKVAVFNRSPGRVDALVAEAEGRPVVGTRSPAELVAALRAPRVVLLMVQAGAAVDEQLTQLLPLLQPGDIVIDGGNSLWEDSNRRTELLRGHGMHFIGMGISGGEEGARHGPSLMPAGDAAAWPVVREMFQAIAAKVDGAPCCQWIGDAGAGHYVKMVHNGIEYGDMQLIAEAYQLLREGLALEIDAVAEAFREWNTGPLESYLIEITGEILGVRAADGAPMVDKILDSAGQKGTGKWTAINALELGVPLTLIAEAVNSRFLSARKAERVKASARLGAPARPGSRTAGTADIRHVHDALYASKIVSYTQGFMLLREAAQTYGWQLAYGDIALVWRGGCIIRSRFLGNIKHAFDRTPDLESLLLDDFFAYALRDSETGWRAAISAGIAAGIPLPAFTSALSFFDGYRSARLPADLIQAQRDYFGAHTYQRVDRPDSMRFHFDWSGRRGERQIDG